MKKNLSITRWLEELATNLEGSWGQLVELKKLKRTWFEEQFWLGSIQTPTPPYEVREIFSSAHQIQLSPGPIQDLKQLLQVFDEAQVSTIQKKKI